MHIETKQTTRRHAMNANNKLEIGDDFEVHNITRRYAAGGTWVIGKVNGHIFNALVFPEHAEVADYELDDSRISKLWLLRIADKKTVVNFDRGWDIRPADATAQAIVDFLAAGLAEYIYHN
jgi:hypothetical protein